MSSEAQRKDPTSGPEHERKLPSQELWQRYRTMGPGDQSEEDLVKKYLPLVRNVVGRLAISLPPHVDSEDLYSAGLVGLLQAVRQYDPALGTAFESYARWRIRGAVLDELRRMDWAPRSVHSKARKVQAALNELEQALGRLPTDVELAAALQISPEEYEKWLAEIRPATFISLDSARAGEGEEELTEHEMLPDIVQIGPEETVSRQELAQLMAHRIKELPELQRKVLALYYFEGLRLNEIAEAFGYCKSHICQVHTKAILAIRSYLEQYEANRENRHRRSA